ncbi:MAG: hypothetical protein DYG89_24805 [Caldilinea sp. CFX5]|nr:hypothetical protein [Caldilinea sp. CFX5]
MAVTKQSSVRTNSTSDKVTAPTADSPCPLLVTKLYIPAAYANQTLRPRLLAQLNAGLRGNLVIISAPAGFGKTTLLAQWHAQADAAAFPHRMAWVTVDAGDNDVHQFWRYVVAALQREQPGVGAATQALLAANQTPLETVLTTLLNELLAAPADYILVLDDYHLIEAPAVHESLAFLLDHLPDNLHLVILGRSDPPLPLARLRLAGALTEVRAADLQFTDAETTAFLNQTMDLELAPAEITALAARTEGWITGLQAAALSLQGHPDPAAAIRAFSGAHRYILDYLVEEVLQQQPPVRQTFLLHTAILNRLSGPLCDAVMGWAAPTLDAPPAPKSQTILAALESANLFITPLDATRTWYRYHPLFADLLRKRLYETQPALAPTLHQRAAAWYEAQALCDEAVAHALAAHDLPHAARLIGPIAPTLIMRGELPKLRRWLQALPTSLLHTDPELALAAAWLALLSGAVADLAPHLHAVEQGLAQLTAAGERETMQARSQAIRALHAALQGDAAIGRALAQQAQTKLPSHYPLARSLLAFAEGVVEQTQGNLTTARRAFVEAQAQSEAGNNLLVALLANRYLVNLEIAAGQLRQAATLAQAALALNAQEQAVGAPRLPVAGAAHVGLGKVLFEWNDLAAARRHLEQGVQWAGDEGGIGVACEGYLLLADLHQAQGDVAAAWRALWTAEQHFQHSPHPAAGVKIAFFRARLALAQGDNAPFRQWLVAAQLTVADAVTPANLTLYLTFARWLLAEQQLTQAHTLLARLAHYAADAGWCGDLIAIQVLQALAWQRQGEMEEALITLRQALTAAAPEGYVRTFVQEGDAMYRLLAAGGLQYAEAAPSLFAYVNRLLAAFDPAPNTPEAQAIAAANGDTATAILDLVEPLSEREIQVLHLLANGATNQVIAEELVIALTTAKKHVSNIIGKLGVANRTQAVARARALGLLT